MRLVSRRGLLRGTLLSMCGVLSLLVAGTGSAAPPQPGEDHAPAGRAAITVTTVGVGAPGNRPVGIVPFADAVYRTCADAPSTPPKCLMVGGVRYRYGIGQLEITVAQWVTFLNLVDPEGRNRQRLYTETESAADWPKYGQINRSSRAGHGRHYSVAYPQWADKPYGFSTFLKAARFVNSLYNGRLIDRHSSSRGGFRYTTYRVMLSARTERGMYDLSQRYATRSHSTGFVVPSQNEWIKAAYYDPHGHGRYSYWKYPTNAGVFGDGDATAPAPTVLDPTTGDVTNATTQPLASYRADGQPAPTWCPGQVAPDDCTTVNPFGLDPTSYANAYQGSLSTVGQARTTSPWGTLDQGGNAVEWTDTITAPPSGRPSARVWRRAHGGVSNAPAVQLWLSAVGLQPQDNAFFNLTYPWLGFRVGVIGDLTPGGRRAGS